MDSRGQLFLRGHCRGFVLQLFFLVICFQGFEEGLELSIHDLLQLVNRESDAVVGHPILGEIIRADFFAAIA